MKYDSRINAIKLASNYEMSDKGAGKELFVKMDIK